MSEDNKARAGAQRYCNHGHATVFPNGDTRCSYCGEPYPGIEQPPFKPTPIELETIRDETNGGAAGWAALAWTLLLFVLAGWGGWLIVRAWA